MSSTCSSLATRTGTSRSCLVEWLGREAYLPVWQRMRDYTDSRKQDSPDRIWVVEHPPVFTQGQAGKPEHLLSPGEIPVVQTDRGGQVTYHGPGQVVIYLLLNVRQLKLGVRELVTVMEQAVIEYLGGLGIDAESRTGAPGVYVGDAKIAALGLRIRKGCSYHGLSFNVSPDLEPFSRINPCGYQGLAVTSLEKLGYSVAFEQAAEGILAALESRLRI